MDEAALPAALREALGVLRQNGLTDTRVDAVQDNWAYIWLPEVEVDQVRYPPPSKRGLWVRIPVQFPHANPHGVVTIEPLVPKDGHTPKRQNEAHETAKPVAGLGGRFYYSWTWSGDIGQGPPLNAPGDILEVVAWVSRRICLA